MDIKDKYKNLDPLTCIKIMWDTSTKKGVAYNYITGAIDALRATDAITAEHYDKLYNKLYAGEL